MFEHSSPFADHVDATFLVIAGASAVVMLGLLAAMVLFIVRYGRKRHPHPVNIDGNVPLEVAWTVIPLVLFLGMFWMGWKGYVMERDIPADAVTIKVTARMWAWSFEYPNGVKTDTLYVPVNTPIKAELQSLDVNHAFFVPAFRLKKDVIPNRGNTTWFRTNKVAVYEIACAEYCGLNHAYMYNKIVSMDSADFERLYAGFSAKQSKPYAPLVAGVPRTERPGI
jgi:cytochrome c oxidase subunit 2